MEPMESPRVLIVEDEEYNRDLYTQIVSSKGCEVLIAEHPEQGIARYEEAPPHLILLDLKFDAGSSRQGLDFLKAIRRRDRAVEVLVISGSHRDATKIEAMLKDRAYDFLEKPVRRDVLSLVIDRILERIHLKRENEALRREIQVKVGGREFPGMIGESPKMLDVFERIRRVARTDSTILLTGETGTGKELAARAIHRLSGRRPFVVADMGKTSAELIGSELFGHERGAFTGAIARRIGKLELARTGTLVLDEIENTPEEVQIKLLRVLQERTFERLGAEEQIELRARIIAITNRDLGTYVRERRFRDDLYHRLNVASIHLPALRERGEDLSRLAGHFLEMHAANLEMYRELTTETMDAMYRYRWPGNVRELRNKLEYALLFGKNDEHIEPEDLELEGPPTGTPEPGDDTSDRRTLKEVVNEAKRRRIRAALREVEGEVGAAAALLGITSRHMRRLMEEFGVS